MGSLLLVRHGQASFQADDYDHLSALGEEQARRLGAAWGRRGLVLDSVYVGPRERHRTHALAATAAHEAGHDWPAPTVLDDLDEIRIDALEAFQRAAAPELLLAAAMFAPPDAPPPGIERWDAFQARVRGAVEAMRAGPTGSRAVAFTSGGPVAATMQLALGLAPEKALELAWAVRNASVSEFRSSSKRFSLVEFNSVAHLNEQSHWTYR